ncbi:unnamed protein product [Symbiodinium necroappetens]|uniref:Uncharacterized protein n=1 Tax=Symbiodinium necroappetens TaxID=1628268 RepID=A0A812SLP1_9DINO|nr:unnamed protein product [Symbiodinium necroappetens]
MALRLALVLTLIGAAGAFRADERSQVVLAANSSHNKTQSGGPDPAEVTSVISHYIQTGHCPTGLPGGKLETGLLPINMEGYDYGMGCNSAGLCTCPHSPFFVCATAGRFGGPEGFLLKGIVSTFGYCRVAAWVWAAGSGVVVLLLGGVVMIMKK